VLRTALSAFGFPLSILALAASCSRGAQTAPPAAGAPQTPLAAYVAQRVAVTPAGHVRNDSLGWVQRLGGTRGTASRLDTSIVTALTERGLAARWVMPAELVRSYERNRTYAADPRQLALEQLRAPTFVAAGRYGEPLSTQLRTMIALHQDMRYVLLPVELRFEKDGAAGRAVLRVALLDPRFAEARWVGDVRGDTTSVPGRALASVASRLADLFIAP
jgi:hypothetical protein